MRPARTALVMAACAVLLIVTHDVGATTRTTEAQTPSHEDATAVARLHWIADSAWFQRLIYVYASGEPAIQQQAVAAGEQAQLTSAQVLRISAAVRAAWKRLMQLDPASLGRTSVRPNLGGQQTALAGLRAALRQIVGARYNTFVAAADRTYALVSNPTWVQAHAIAFRRFGPPPRYRLVWATSFAIPNTPDSARYVALPDVYLKFANLGWNGQIPSLYQPYYLPAAGSGRPSPPYTVDIASFSGRIVATSVAISDVGPWNEDDNWWDPTYTGATPPEGCPLASTRVSASSLTNPAVNGICPGTSNWRRTYYYLLYRHASLPFFQASAYRPTGPYRDVTAWPPTLNRFCSEAAHASINDDGSICAVSGYNDHNSTWLRDDTFNAPILNQASIDLSPGMDSALGWVYPSSGFILVNTSRLP
ncbi:MAG TPA: hypothetical protein VGP82_14760 [Ktedonobacterales bacterium]|nr:hypothetical protein [Ktedonobacterales bacterium]